MSGWMNLNLTDFGHGLLTAVIGAIGTYLVNLIQGGTAIPTLADLKAALLVGVGAGISYIVLTLFKNQGGTLGKGGAPTK